MNQGDLLFLQDEEKQDEADEEKTKIKANPYSSSDNLVIELTEKPELKGEDAADTTMIRSSGLNPVIERPAAFVVEKGATIGEYVLEEKIGEGGMGEIWRGSQPLIGKQVALKILRPKMAYDKEAVARFVQEARSVNAIKHKGLIDIFSFGDLPDGRPYFVMEFLEGESLASRLTQQGPLPWYEIIELFSQVCRALGAAHERGIVHRDLKSENLFLVKDPAGFQVKLLDFGIAKLSGDENAQLTQAGDIFGTPAYMSPEHCRGKVDLRSDIYSLGVLLYETITGRTPFFEPGAKVADILAKQLYEEPLPPSTMVTGRKVPADVDKLVLKILSKEPDDRPQNCDELGNQINKVIGPLAFADKSSGGARPVFDSTLKIKLINGSTLQRAPRPWLLPVVAVLSIVAGYGAFALLTPPEPRAVTPTSTIAPIEAKPSRVRLSVSSTPEGAEVFLGGTLLGTTPLKQEIDYDDTPQTLRITKEGFLTEERPFTANNPDSFAVPLTAIQTEPQSTKVDLKKDPKTEPGKDPKTDPTKDPKVEPTKDPKADPGKDPGKEPKDIQKPPTPKCDPNDPDAICGP